MTANGGPYFGETIGRYGNRIAKGTFTLNQPGQGPVKYTLPINNGVNSLHGGLVGFGNHIWADRPVYGNGSVGVQLTLVSPNGDEGAAAGSPGCPTGCTGYPAQIKVVLTYTLNNSQPAGPALHDHQPVQEPQHDPQPDQPQLLQPGRRELVPRLGLRPADPGSTRTSTRRPTPPRSRSAINASVFGTPFNFTRFVPDGRPDSRTSARNGQFPRLQPAPGSPGL